jgi:hypothetical protein
MWSRRCSSLGFIRPSALCALVALMLALLAPVASATGRITIPAGPNPVRLRENIYEYSYTVRTGNGPYDRIKLHRVIQVHHGQPVQAVKAVFLVHGDVWNFNAAFLGGSRSPRSLPVSLAEGGIDAWGIDLDWSLVPKGTDDLSFMKDWGLQHEIDTVETGIAFARSIRMQTGSPGNPVVLLAWSRGGWIGYALLNEESQKPVEDRQVSAYIPVDMLYKTDDQSLQTFICRLRDAAQQDLGNGIFGYDDSIYKKIGQLARRDPNGTSPYFLHMTNLQAALTVGAAGFHLGRGLAPYYHFFAGKYPGNDYSQIPKGLRYTTIPRFEDFLIGGSPLESVHLILDTWEVSCEDTPNQFDDHLGDITVPVLYVGAGGGFGTEGLYTLSLLGSSDVTTNVVSLFPPSKAALDFGHADLYNATNAGKLVWEPMEAWLATHG